MLTSLKACDVCVVGGGPAGLSAAIAIRQQALSVTVVDCAIPPIDKACGEGLLPHSIAALRELGIEIPSNFGARFSGIRFVDAHSSVIADFPNGLGVGIRRTVLHQLLVKRATQMGVRFLWGVKHIALSPAGVTVNGKLLKSVFVVAADGQNSAIRRQAGLHLIRQEHSRYAFRRHYRLAPWSPYVELYWGSRCQIYVTPVAGDEVCLALTTRYPKLRLDDALADFPVLENHLRTAARISAERGALSVSRNLHRVYNRNVVLVGDASGSVDAVSGEGLGLAFRQALLVARALNSGELREYQEQHTRLTRKSQRMASLLLFLEKHKQLQRRALAALSEHPQLFASLLSIHVGDSSFFDVGARPLLNFGYTFLAS